MKKKSCTFCTFYLGEREMVKNETKILIEEALKNTAYNIIQLKEKKVKEKKR